MAATVSRAVALLCALLLPAIPAGAGSDWSIVSGQEATPGEWPSMAALVYNDSENELTGQFCGGTLIDPSYVLTASHCFFPTDGSPEPDTFADQIHVVLGRHDLLAEGGESIAVAEVILHPEYRNETGHLPNDVALVRLATPSSQPTQRLIAAGEEGLWSGGQTGMVTGWGTRTFGNNDDKPNRLHEAAVTVRSDSECQASNNGTLDLALHLCAGGGFTGPEPGPDSCTGDSGGPLFVPDAAGISVQIGVISFGDDCGRAEPGVYARLVNYRDFIAQHVGQPGPVDPGPGPDITRIAADAAPTEPVTQAAAVSRVAFGDAAASYGLLARADTFPDALAGSALGFGQAPLLFSPSGGPLPAATAAELQRVVQPGGTVYLLGGEAALSPAVESEVAALGFAVMRLAGSGREGTAARVAEEVVSRHGTDGGPPDGTVVVATGSNWPDAVGAGGLSAYWGYPILVTPRDLLHPDAEAALRDLAPGRVLVVGGEAAISAEVAAAIADITGVEPERLGGAGRVQTGVLVARASLALFGPDLPAGAVAVAADFRREPDGYAHVLSATMLTGVFGGVIAPLDNQTVLQEVRDLVCGGALDPVIAGGSDLIGDAAAVDFTGAARGACG